MRQFRTFQKHSKICRRKYSTKPSNTLHEKYTTTLPGFDLRTDTISLPTEEMRKIMFRSGFFRYFKTGKFDISEILTHKL
jgi:hypothetical protein